jgi:transmembrane sensor
MTDERPSDPDSLDWQDVERALHEVPPRYDSARAWAKLEGAIDEPAPPADGLPLLSPPPARRDIGTRPRFSSPNWAARIAAILVLGGAIPLAWQATRPATETLALAAMREVETEPGQRATVRLADGTRVEVGADSRLRYMPELGGARREVYLEGEAYFDVVHDDRRPFVVHTARAVVRDLGTKFNVRSYADVPAVEVVVAEGAVAVAPGKGGDPRDSLLLHAGDLGRLEADGKLVARRGVDVGAHLSWMDGRLQLIDVPLREAALRLAHWYGADIRLADSAIATRRYTASLKDETLPQLLDLMALALELRVDRAGDTILLYGKSNKRSRSPSH